MGKWDGEAIALGIVLPGVCLLTMLFICLLDYLARR